MFDENNVNCISVVAVALDQYIVISIHCEQKQLRLTFCDIQRIVVVPAAVNKETSPTATVDCCHRSDILLSKEVNAELRMSNTGRSSDTAKIKFDECGAHIETYSKRASCVRAIQHRASSSSQTFDI